MVATRCSSAFASSSRAELNGHASLGLESFGPHYASLDLWFDALVMSTTPIGGQ